MSVSDMYTATQSTAVLHKISLNRLDNEATLYMAIPT